MCCEFHTSGQSFGKVMSEINPRHAVAYHNFDELLPSVRDGIREIYDGPLSMATDMMVWNITKEKVTERMTVSPDRAWAVKGPTPQPPPERGRPNPMSDFINDGEWGPGFNAQNKMLDAYAEKFNLQEQDWRLQKAWYKPEK